MGGRRSYLVFREDLFVVHTKPVTEERARWLLEEAYYKVPSLELRKRYLNQWGNVLDLTGDKWIEWWGLDRVLPGVYTSKEDLLARAREAAKDDEAMARSRRFRRRLEELEKALDEFLARPVEPKRLERHPRQPPPALRYVMMRDFLHVRWSKWQQEEYLVPRPEWYTYHNYSFLGIYGISIFSGTFWLWRQQELKIGGTEAIIVRRGATFEELASALFENGDASQFLQKHDRLFVDLIRKRENDMERSGYGDIARSVKHLVVLSALASPRRGREEEEEGLPA